MFSTLRTRFGIPGVISVMALVFAMFGGAYAASNSSGGGKATASAKAKQGPRGKTGKTGPAGPAGPQGPAGVKGDAGAAGASGREGTNGADGKTIRSGTGAPEGGVSGNTGDFYIRSSTSQVYGPKTGANGTSTGWGTPTDLKGEDGGEGPPGDPWTLGGTLPEESTETGSFVVSDETGEGSYFGYAMTAISFPVPLEPKNCVIDPGPPPFELQIGVCAADVHVTGESGDATCTGNSANPTAPSGQLCVYKSFSYGSWGNLEVAPETGSIGAGVTFGAGIFGAYLSYPTNGSAGFAGGSWAVTG